MSYKKSIINEDELFNRFNSYSYRDIENIEVEIINLLTSAVNSEVCLDILKENSVVDYMASIIEYFTYNNIPIKHKYKLEYLLCSSTLSEDNLCISMEIIYGMSNDRRYTSKYEIYLGDNREIKYISTNLFINNKLIDLTK